MLKSICTIWINDCVQHIILQKFTNFQEIRSWNFRIFAMRWWPRFFASPCIYTAFPHTHAHTHVHTHECASHSICNLIWGIVTASVQLQWWRIKHCHCQSGDTNRRYRKISGCVHIARILQSVRWFFAISPSQTLWVWCISAAGFVLAGSAYEDSEDLV